MANENRKELLARKFEDMIQQFTENEIIQYIFEYFSDDASDIYLKQMDEIIKVNFPGSNELLNDLSRFLLKKELTGETKCPICGNDKLTVHREGYRQSKKYGIECSWFCQLCGNQFGTEDREYFSREVFSIEKWRNQLDKNTELGNGE